MRNLALFSIAALIGQTVSEYTTVGDQGWYVDTYYNFNCMADPYIL